MAEVRQPYSRRDPYWGVDDYGRPLSYGRPSLYGPPQVSDPAQLAMQLTYLQPRPDQLPIDPTALKAPSVFRPLWPGSAQPAAARPLTRDDQATERIDIGQQTMRFAVIGGDEQLTIPAVPRPDSQSEQMAWPITEPRVSSVAPRGRGYLAAVVTVVLALLIVVVLYRFADSHSSSPMADTRPTGAFQQAWQAPELRLTLDETVVNDTVVSVECQPASQGAGGAGSAQNFRQRQSPILRTREGPAGCVLLGRGLIDGKLRWKLDRQPIGMTLASAGPAVIAYGGEQALAVSAASGEIIRTFTDGILLGHTATTAVFTELLATATSRVMAIDVTDGHQLWQSPIAQSSAAENARALSQASVAVPSGLDRMYYDGLDSDSRYVMVPDAVKAGQYAIREIATGRLAENDTYARSRPDSTVGVAAGYALHVTGAGGRRVLHGTALDAGVNGSGSAGRPWSYELPLGGYVAACSGLVCVQDVAGHRSAVLDPTSGEPIYRNDTGWSYIRRSGDLVGIMRCSAPTDSRGCPSKDTTVEVIRSSDHGSVWSSKRPAFVVPQHFERDGYERLMIGVAEGNRIRVFALSSQSSRPVMLGTVPLKALESVTPPVGHPAAADQSELNKSESTKPELNQKVAAPNLSCVATTVVLSCGSRWTPMRATTWNMTV